MNKSNTTEQLLVSLGWSGLHVNFNGSKTWVKVEDDENGNCETITTGLLLVTDKVICARVRTQENGHKILSLMEAIWDLNEGNPKLRNYCWMNEKIDAEDESIVRAFSNHIENIGDKGMQFVSTGLRKKQVNVVPLPQFEL